MNHDVTQHSFENTFNIVKEKFIEGSIVLFSFDHPKKQHVQKNLYPTKPFEKTDMVPFMHVGQSGKQFSSRWHCTVVALVECATF